MSVFPKLSLGDEVRRLGNYVKVLHIHDNLGDKDAHLFPTFGSLDWQDFANSLSETGFLGVFSLETSPSGELCNEDFERECVRLCEISRKIADAASAT